MNGYRKLGTRGAFFDKYPGQDAFPGWSNNELADEGHRLGFTMEEG